jgi:hypothetical protein
VIHQPIEQKRIDPLRLRICTDARIEIRRAALDQKNHRARIPLRRMATGNRHQTNQGEASP